MSCGREDLIVSTFSIERFEMSIRTLLTFCKGGKSNKYYDFIFNPSNSMNVKHSIYKGSFVESVEYLYGFIPEVFKEYCRQFGVTIESRDGTYKTIGYIDLLNSMHSVDKISLDHISLLKNVFSNRGYIIHNTLIERDVYYTKLSWIALQLDKHDLNKLYRYVKVLCDEINESYRNGVNGKLVVKLKCNKNKIDFKSSNVW